ncbi:MAG: hypothetical protein M1832_001577 [Thelocarpon impressellum]|nr:MAG: hypothetical protein M1832_001577 [Thelocarpon impressellum]
MSVVPEAPLPESIPHAVTTPDDTAWPLKAPVPGSQVAELADVVEEDEDGYSKGTSLPLSELWSTSSALRLTRSVPNLKALRNGSTASPMANADPMSEERPRSQMSDTLGGPFCQSPVKGAAGVPGSSKILSEGTRVVESCWEDDIDYCYEHAAEADFDYRWETYSNGDGQTTRAQGQDLDSLEMSRQPAFASLREMRGFDAMPRSDSPDIDVAHGAIFPSQRNVPPAVHVPSDLDGGVVEPSPAASFSTYASEAITPSDSVVPTQSSGIRTGSYDSAFEEQDDMIRHPSLILSRGFDAQNLQDCMYEELLANDGKIGTQYALYDGPIAPRASVSESLRSDTSLSKCNSQSSMVLQGGGAAAAGTARGTAAQRHLSVNSAGSLPELVHSRTRRDEFDAVAGQLAEQIAALKVVDEMQHAGPSIPAVRRCRVGPNVAGRLEAAQKGASAEGAALRRSNMGRGRAHSEAGLTVISAVAVPEGPSSSTNRMRSTSLVEGQAGLAS